MIIRSIWPQQKAKILARLHRAYRYSVLRKLLLWLKGKTLHWAVYLAAATLVAVGALGLHTLITSYYYVVRVDGYEVGLVREAEEVNQFVDDLMEQCGALYAMEVFPQQEITLTRELRWGEEADLQQACARLRQHIRLFTEAAMVMVDGNPVAPVSSEEEIASIIDFMAQAYVRQDEKVKLLDVKLKEDICSQSCTVDPEDVYTAEAVAELLTQQDQPEDELYASRTLYAARSGRDEFRPAAQPLPKEAPELPDVHVITVEEAIVEEAIPFPTTYVDNGNMFIGESREIKPGVDGVKECAYRVTRENGEVTDKELISERVIVEPVARVVERGTARRFIWPVSSGGRITQYFRGSAHRGIDIAASAGTAVVAADSGVVVISAYEWPMGNYIVIRHSGYWTVYLHHSRNIVSAGQQVSRGQTIAYVGSTGYSTGPHLHFEIRRSNGSSAWGYWTSHPAINPLQFF
ncbi:MAG TPA: peptidoglycan DD-metalloendopeptidase family protein [Bacillota bacterium]|nr:peptidoglycan DD-metalloendopeptidase family protein [Bacillota bacterium]